MPSFVRVSAEDGRSQYVNLDQIRTIEDHPDEQSVRVDFDSQHRVYLDRERAKDLIKLLGPAKKK